MPFTPHAPTPLFAAGDLVEVAPAYVGRGRYAADGNEGVYTVLSVMLGGEDYKLARGRLDVSQLHDWELMCHASRMRLLDEAPAWADCPPCAGEGSLDGEHRCPSCAGSGRAGEATF